MAAGTDRNGPLHVSWLGGSAHDPFHERQRLLAAVEAAELLTIAWRWPVYAPTTHVGLARDVCDAHIAEKMHTQIWPSPRATRYACRQGRRPPSAPQAFRRGWHTRQAARQAFIEQVIPPGIVSHRVLARVAGRCGRRQASLASPAAGRP